MAEVNNNRYALITGASSGIGYELAKLFAEDGYNLIIVALQKKTFGMQQRNLKNDME